MVGKKGSQRLFSRTEHSLSVAAISGRIKESLDRFGVCVYYAVGRSMCLIFCYLLQLTGDLVRELMARETHEVLKETQNILRSTAVVRDFSPGMQSMDIKTLFDSIRM